MPVARNIAGADVLRGGVGSLALIYVSGLIVGLCVAPSRVGTLDALAEFYGLRRHGRTAAWRETRLVWLNDDGPRVFDPESSSLGDCLELSSTLLVFLPRARLERGLVSVTERAEMWGPVQQGGYANGWLPEGDAALGAMRAAADDFARATDPALDIRGEELLAPSPAKRVSPRPIGWLHNGLHAAALVALAWSAPTLARAARFVLSRRMRRVRRGQCGTCGYPVLGLLAYECPECGTLIASE